MTDQPQTPSTEAVELLADAMDAVAYIAGTDAARENSELIAKTMLTASPRLREALEGPRHPDAGNLAANHYDWVTPENPRGHVDGYLDDLETKLTEALTDPFVHDMAQTVLPLIAAYRQYRSQIAALRSDLMWHHGQTAGMNQHAVGTGDPTLCATCRVLSDTASAATEEVERIRADALAPLLALAGDHCENFTTGDCYAMGRETDAVYGADQACWPCIIRGRARALTAQLTKGTSE